MFRRTALLALLAGSLFTPALAQQSAPMTAPASGAGAANVALHLLPSTYKTPYGPINEAEVKATLDRIHAYLASQTPMELVDRTSRASRRTSIAAPGMTPPMRSVTVPAIRPDEGFGCAATAALLSITSKLNARRRIIADLRGCATSISTSTPGRIQRKTIK